jgi:Baseplate J-like protein
VIAPPVDPRDFASLVRDTKTSIRKALDIPEPPAGEDAQVPGEGIVRIFARLAEIVVDRLNGVPDKNLLAFLGLVGVDREPPQPAYVPLTFHLAQGATRARVPAGTAAAAAPAEGETDAPVYETESELVLTATLPVAAFTREPARDLYRDATAVTTRAGTAVPVFAGAVPIPHELYVADPLLSLPQPKDVTLRLGPFDAAHRWPAALAWSRFDGAAWQPVDPTVGVDAATNAWQLTFTALPPVAPTTVAGIAGAWLRARIETPLPPPEPADGEEPPPDTVQQAGLPPDAVFADGYRLDPGGPLAPFGESVPRQRVSIACQRALSKPGAAVTIDVEVDTTVPATPAASLELTWSYWNGSAWAALGTSTPDAATEPQGEAEFIDGTQAFTRDGTITFSAPADWSEAAVAGVTGYWLQAAITGGDFGSPPAYAAPMLRRLTLAYTWPLPRVQTLTRRVVIGRSNLRPDGALFGVTPLDLTKDVQPFGERPRFNDVFYLAADEALALPGARITLRITGTKNVSAAGKPVLVWEVYDAASGLWKAATVEQDTTEALTFAHDLSAVVVLRAPAPPAPVALAGQEHYWLRARLVGGDYGKDADFTTSKDTATGQTIVTPIKASWDPPSIKTVTIDYDFAAGPGAPAGVATLNDFRTSVPTGPFLPFTVTEDERPTFYLGVNGDFANDATTLFFELPDVTYSGAGGLIPAEPPAVVWEYRSPDGWQPLGTRDETRGFRGHGLLAFVAPADMSPSTEFSVSARWLRARWERGGYAASPQLARVLTNTIWARHVATVRDEVLGSSTGEERQVFRTARAPVLPGQRIDVRELGPPSAAELGTILAEEGEDAVAVVPATSDTPPETWVRWHEVVDFYGSGPRSRHYVLDRLTGDVRFGDARRGMPPPQGHSNIRATLYETGGGAVGNRPAGAVVQLKTAVPYVDNVTNPEPAAGGADAEAVEAVRERGPRQLRHGDRAVTIADVEDLARAASPGIARVLGVSATAAEDAGRVGLVVVPATAARQPVPSVELLARVQEFVENRLPPIVDLWVAGPGWVQIAVTAEVVPVSLERATDVQSAVRAALETFLHPLSGGPHAGGWPFGRTPRRSDLLALIERVPGVDHVRGLSVARAEAMPPPVPAALLVYSADHTIAMAGSTEGGEL